MATRLVRKCLEYLESKGTTFARLYVLARNKAAINLYRKLGFEDYVLIAQKKDYKMLKIARHF